MAQSPPFQWANESTPTPTSLSLPSNFILPSSTRPDLTHISCLKSIPVIDLDTDDEVELAEGIARACEGFGFFQVINHGIPEKLCKDVVDVITRFFHLPSEEKSHLVTTKHMKDGAIFKYYVKNQETQEKISVWSESFFHNWHPTNDGFIQNLPNNPTDYRSMIATYAKEMGFFVSKLLNLISLGLGLDRDYLEKKLGQNPMYTAQANYYPPCPNPELTLGLPPHTDFNVLTVLLQEEGVTGLHVVKDGKWVAIDPVPGALVINVADQLQVLSNDKYKSVYHRAVTNEKKKRVSYAMFVGPSIDSVVAPIEELTDKAHPPLYHNYTFSEFIQEFRNQEGKPRRVKETFRIN